MRLCVVKNAAAAADNDDSDDDSDGGDLRLQQLCDITSCVLYCTTNYNYVAYLSSVTRVYCDKMTEARITQFSSKSSSKYHVLYGKFDVEISTGPLNKAGGSNYGGLFLSLQ